MRIWIPPDYFFLYISLVRVVGKALKFTLVERVCAKINGAQTFSLWNFGGGGEYQNFSYSLLNKRIIFSNIKNVTTLL